MSNYLKRKEDALRVFLDNANNFPLWRICELGKTNPIYSNMLQGDESETIKLFKVALGDLYPDKIYTVSMYKNLLHRKGGYKFTKPNFEFSFQFDRVDSHSPVMNGTAQTMQVPSAGYISPPTSNLPPYAVDTRQQINLNDHVALIGAKAKAEADCQYWMQMFNEQKKLNIELERKLQVANDEIDELEEELDEMEENERDEEMSKIGEAKNESIESALASVLKDNGGVLLENLFSKGVKGGENLTPDEISGEGEEQEQDNKTVNGMPSGGVFLMSLSMDELNNKMLSVNPKWKQHLCKLILIGEQKPATFKMFISKLENF